MFQTELNCALLFKKQNKRENNTNFIQIDGQIESEVEEGVSLLSLAIYQFLNSKNNVINNKLIKNIKAGKMSEVGQGQGLLFTADNIFKKYDTNLSDKLEEHQVQQLLRDAFKQMGIKEQVSRQRVKLFITRIDRDGDNKISKAQLWQALKVINNI